MDFADSAVCADHGFFQPRIDQVNFLRSAHQVFLIFLRNWFSDQSLDGAHELLRFDFLKVFLQPAESHMGKVLSPFEVRHRNTTGIQENIRDDKDAARVEALFGAWSCWAIGSFGENFGVDPVAVFKRDLIFESGGNQDIARDIPNAVRPGQCLGIGEILDRARLVPKLIQVLDGKPFRIVESGCR